MQIKPIISAEHLTFSYNNSPVIDDISFDITAGDYVGIIGPNGGGKTTLLKILVGLIKPQSGSIKINGKNIKDKNATADIGYVPQRVAMENSLFPATVYEIIESGLLAKKGLFGRATTRDKERIDTALKEAQIYDLKDRLMSSLSGGQRQRVYVTRALASNPSILVLDEPFTGIDMTSQKNFYTFLKELNTNKHLTILFVSHDIDTITQEIKSVLCLNRGQFCFGAKEVIHQENTIEKIYGKNITHIHHGS